MLVPPQPQPPVRVGRVINPAKGPAKFDNLLFDTKVLSRNHAEVYCDAQGRVFIRDLGSSNGTYINGVRLSADAVASDPFPLIAGQELVYNPPPIHPRFTSSSLSPLFFFFFFFSFVLCIVAELIAGTGH